MDYQINYEQYVQNQEKLKQLWEAAHLDSLTHLYNRYGMDKWITQKLAAQKQKELSALLIIDVDNFKQVNDTYGHMLGDALLVDIADDICRIFKKQYFCGRVGGDEYQIFAPNIESRNQIEKSAGLLCHLIKKKYEKKYADYGVSLSIGISFAQGNRVDYAELYKQADTALYQAKKRGKNGCAVYQSCYKKEGKMAPPPNCSDHIVEHIGESGFSASKVLLDQIIRILEENPEPKEAIEKACRVIVDTFDVTRAYASCYTEDELHIGKSYFYAQTGEEDLRPNLPFSGREYEKKCFNKDSIFFCTDITKIPEPVQSVLKRMGVNTLLQVLIHKDGKIIGTLGINNCGYKRLWQQNEIETIHTIALLMKHHIYRLQQES